jgi:hypothetical protein
VQCRGFQFEIGKTYEHDGPIKLCGSGFHFCTSPTEIFTYYENSGHNRYALIEASGVSDETGDDSKRVAKTITVVKELTWGEVVAAEALLVPSVIAKIIEESPKVFTIDAIADGEGVEAASGNYSTQAASGYNSKQAASGENSTQAASGYNSTQAASGNYSTQEIGTNGVACAAGLNGRFKGGEGSAFALTYKDANGRYRIAVGYVGEDGIKADTWYKTDSSGKIVEA